MTALFFIGLIAVGGGLFFWLFRREENRKAAGLPRLSTWRLVIAAIFGLVALFSGGCSLLFVPDALKGNQYIDPVAVLVIGGIPFAVSCLIVLLSLWRVNG